MIAANIDTSGEPRLDGKIPKSQVVEIDGRKIGIIGYLTRETMVIIIFYHIDYLMVHFFFI